MARSRNIKPGFFTNENLVELDFATRILFIGLWTEADREGRLEDRPKRLKMALFPADNVDVDQMLSELAASGFIRRYTANGVRAIQVVNWSKHQNPHVKESASTIPAECEHQTSTMQAQEIPERAGLIPDSLSLDSGFLIPDSQQDQKPLSPASPATVAETPSKKSAKFDPLTAKPLNVSSAAWADWCDHRKKSRMTERACELIAKKLASHHDPDAVLYLSIQNGWTGLFPEQITHENSTPNRPAGRLSAVDQVRQAIADREARTIREVAADPNRQALAEDDRNVRPPLDGEFRHVG